MPDWRRVNSEEFIKRLKSDDEAAFAELYAAVIKGIVSLLIKQFENVELTITEAEEIANDAMLKVSKAISKFNSKRGAKLTSWLFNIAVNQTKDFLRKRDSDKAQAVVHEYLEETELNAKAEKAHIDRSDPIFIGTADSSQEKESKEKIITRKAFDALKESDQDIIRMKSVMEYEDIAKIENKTVNALSTQYARALERFKKNLQNLDQQGV